MRLALIIALAATTGCTSLYYNAMEKIGKEKRDILLQRIIDSKKDQEKAKEQFKTTLEAFQNLTGFDGGDLEKTYKKLNGEFEDAEKRANDLSERIKSIDQVASDLFKEWNQELSTIKDSSLHARSAQLLRQTRLRHQQYIARMRQTERKMLPVLQGFRDQVLFLKHNLNAKAIGSLKTTAAKMDTDVGLLVADIEGSIKEADSFIQSLSTPT
jgi:predicted nuclease with TOPRIM domain